MRQWLLKWSLVWVWVLFQSLRAVKGTTTVVDVLTGDPNYSSLIYALQRTGLVPEFNRYNHTTLFAPTNEAFRRAGAKIVPAIGDTRIDPQFAFEVRSVDEQRDLLRYHTLAQVFNHSAGDMLYHTKMIPRDFSLAGETQVLRTKILEDGTIVVGSDDLGKGGVTASNSHNITDGFVFPIDNFLQLPPTLATLIRTLPELRRWREILPPAFLDQLEYQPHLTAFLPSNHAFGEDDILGEDSITLFGRHVSGTGLQRDGAAGLVGYSSHFDEGETTLRTIAGSKIHVQCSAGSLSLVGAGKVARQDILAFNGVLHLIDTILPNRPQMGALEGQEKNSTLASALVAARASKFLHLIETTGLLGWVERLIANEKCTILAPRDDVLDDGEFPWNLILGSPAGLPVDASGELQPAIAGRGTLVERRAMIAIVKYHLLLRCLYPADLHNGMLIESELQPRELSGARQRVRVTLNLNAPLEISRLDNGDITFEDAAVISEPYEFDQGIIYLLSGLLEPPQDAITVFIRDAPHLSTFIAAVYAANLAPTLRSTPAVTYLVPTNEAFSNLGLVESYLLLPQARRQLRELVRYHGILGINYLFSFGDGSHMFPTLSGTDLLVDRTKNGTLQVHSRPHHDQPLTGVLARKGRIIEGDHLLATGVMHVVDQVLMPPSIEIGMKELLLGGDADTFLDMLRLANMTFVLNTTTCGTKRKVEEGQFKAMSTPEYCAPAFTIFAPSDKAFTQTNLTDLFDDPEMLIKLVRQHIVPGPMTLLKDNLEIKTMLSEPYTRDGLSGPASEASDYGNLFLRRVGPNPFDFLIGIKGARQSGGLEGPFGARHEFANVISGGRTTSPVGGGLFILDNVIWPYRPTWWEEWRQALGLAMTLLVFFGLIAFAVVKTYRRRKE